MLNAVLQILQQISNKVCTRYCNLVDIFDVMSEADLNDTSVHLLRYKLHWLYLVVVVVLGVCNIYSAHYLVNLNCRHI
jgi:hypothetical protein